MKQGPISRRAQRCVPYSDGPWCFAYDPAHIATLRELRAYDALLGSATGGDADSRLERIAADGLVVACELSHDLVAAEILVGARLSAADKRKASWFPTQRGYLRITSGRLRFDSMNTVAFGPDAPAAESWEMQVPAGEFDVVLHRVALEDVTDGEEESAPGAITTMVLELTPVGKKGPRTKAACLRLADVLGDTAAWLRGGAVTRGEFVGTTRAHARDASIVFVNLLAAHADAIGLRFGRRVELVAGGGDTRVVAPFTGQFTRRALETYLGAEWCERHLAGESIVTGLSPFDGSVPWLLEAHGEGVRDALAVDAPVTVRVRDDWCEVPRTYRGEHQVRAGAATARIVWMSGGTIILNIGWEALTQAGIGNRFTFATVTDTREVVADRGVHAIEAARATYMDGATPGVGDVGAQHKAALKRWMDASARVAEAQFEGRDTTEAQRDVDLAWAECQRLKAQLAAAQPRDEQRHSVPLIASDMPSWDDPESRLIWLRPLVGDRHFVDAATGSEVTLRA